MRATVNTGSCQDCAQLHTRFDVFMWLPCLSGGSQAKVLRACLLRSPSNSMSIQLSVFRHPQAADAVPSFSG